MPKYVDDAGLARFWDNIQDQIASASDEQVAAWLDEHPEATTTVQDGAVTTAKIADGAVTEDKLATDLGTKVSGIRELAYEAASENGLTSLTAGDWQNGYVQTNRNVWNFGQLQPEVLNAIITTEKLYAMRDQQVYCDSNYEMALYPYSGTTDDTFLYGQSGYTYNDLMWKRVLMVPKGIYYRVACRLSPNDSSAVLDPTTVHKCVHFITDAYASQYYTSDDIRPSIIWKAGEISSGVVDWTKKVRLVTKDILTANRPLKLVFDATVIKPYVFYYDSSDAYLGQGDATMIPRGARYRLALSAADGETTCHFAHALALAVYEMSGNFMWYGTSNGESINYITTRVMMCMPERYEHAVVLALSDYTKYKVGAYLRSDDAAVSTIDYEALHAGPVGVPAGQWFFAYLGKVDDTAFTLAELNEAVSMLRISPLYGHVTAIDGIRNELAVVKGRITALEGETLPTYYESATYSLSDKIASILSANTKSIEEVTQFAYVTDFHATEYTQTMKTRALLNKVIDETNCAMFVNGGDVVDGKLISTGVVSSIDFAKQMRQYSNWLVPDGCNLSLMVAGNHDGGASWNPTGDALIDEQALYDNSALARTAGNVVLDPNGKCQMYVDDSYHKIRWIVGSYGNTTNIGKWDETQEHGVLGESNADCLSFIGWALDTMGVGWTAVVFNHILINSWDNGPVKGSQALEDLCDMYNAKGSGTLQGRAFAFTDAVGEVACIIGGHLHMDYTYDTTGGIPCIITTTDNAGGQYKLNAQNVLVRDATLRPAGSAYEQAIDVFTIDTENRTIGAVRIGYGQDRSWTY